MFSLKDDCPAWVGFDYIYVRMIYWPLKIKLLSLSVAKTKELIVTCDFSPVLRRGM